MPRVPHPVALLSLCFLLIRSVAAQAPAQDEAPAGPPPAPVLQRHAPESAGPTLSAATQLVVVDITVQDKAGNPVHGLTRQDFQLNEGKTPQTLSSFDEHTTSDLAHVQLRKLPPLPPGVFTDHTPVPEGAALNVLLLDTVNTPMQDQNYVRSQLANYVKTAPPGQRIALFGLNQRLVMLQGFTSDPDILKNIVGHKLLPRASSLLDDPVAGGSADTMSEAMAEAGASAGAVASMQQFEANTATYLTTMRVQYTLEAFNQLARYLAAFPGRKNVLWFSGSFPLTIFGDPTLPDPFQAQADFSEALRETATLLDRARIAVYPIDARGLQANPVFNAASSGRGTTGNAAKFAKTASDWETNNAQEHMAMDQIAGETGGHAFYNTNGLADAVGKAIESGSNYYTITYSPTDRNFDGGYRAIHVRLAGEAADRKLKLSYRTGYYADDPANPRNALTTPLLGGPAATQAPGPGTAAHAMAALQRGGPAPSEILFKVRVLPDSNATAASVAPGNSPNPRLMAKGPFRIYDIDFATLISDIALKPGTDNLRHGRVEFATLVYDADGQLLNAAAEAVTMKLTAASYTALQRQGFRFRMQVSAPARSDSFLRIAVHDLTTGRYGVVEVPTSIVAKLPPPPALPQAAGEPAAGTPGGVSQGSAPALGLSKPTSALPAASGGAPR